MPLQLRTCYIADLSICPPFRQVVEAKVLYAQLGEERSFEDWIAAVRCTPSSLPDGPHAFEDTRTGDMYFTPDAAKEIVIMSPTAAGKEYRQYLIEAYGRECPIQFFAS